MAWVKDSDRNYLRYFPHAFILGVYGTYACNMTLFLQLHPAWAHPYCLVGDALECDAPILSFACSCHPLLKVV